MIASTCLPIGEGIIALFEAVDALQVQAIKPTDVSLVAEEYGISIRVNELIIPVPELLIDHLAQSGTVLIYNKGLDKYVADPISSIELSKQGLAEAKGAYGMWKKMKVKG